MEMKRGGGEEQADGRTKGAGSEAMDSDDDGGGASPPQLFDRFYNPFPLQSTTLVVGPSNCGKTWLLKELLENQHLFFPRPVQRVLVVNCRPGIKFYELEVRPNSPRPPCKVTECDWEDFDLDRLQPEHVVIVDDLQEVTPLLRALITTAVHHRGLAHLFVVTHTLLRTPKYELISHAHRIVLLMRCSTVSSLGLFLVQRLFRDAELKEYLKKILGAAERQKTVLLVQLNNLAGAAEPYHIALSHLQERTDPDFGYCVVYSHPYHLDAYERRSRETQVASLTRKALLSAKKRMPKQTDLVPGSFLVLSPECVDRIRKTKVPPDGAAGELEQELGSDGGAQSREGGCLNEGQAVWNQTVLNLETDIENFVPSKKWMRAKNLLSEILRNPDICILEDQRRMRLKSDRSAVVSLLDFVVAACRREGPSERRSKGNSKEYKLYKQFTRSLLERHAPQMLFVNKLLLPSLSGEGGRRARGGSSSRKKSSRRKKNRYCSGDRCTGRHKKERTRRTPSPDSEREADLSFLRAEDTL